MDKPKKLSREEIAKIEIGHTTITRTQSLVVGGLFLAFIALYPLVQVAYEYHTRAIRTPLELQPLKIFPLLHQVKFTKNGKTLPAMLEYNRSLIAAIKKYEDMLEDTSALRAECLPTAQRFMTAIMKSGNEKVILGADGWLFYASDFNYLVNPGFMRPERQLKRSLSGVQPNPVQAIVAFGNQLAARGIKLVLLPVPVKPMLYGDKLRGDMGVLQNCSYDRFLVRLQAAGVTVIDVADKLAAMRRRGVEPYLKTDTHWTPEGMQLAAREVAAALARPRGRAVLRAKTVPVTALGDIAVMLKLSHPKEFFPEETVTVRQVATAPDRHAAILLLGDSFTNIYSLEAMNWGGHGGLAENLAY
ncbi:MAG: hypothetical protein PHQ27_06690, partial [Victivallales bacterium]|nr:hypothetical protein [Victivallales bacterium]